MSAPSGTRSTRFQQQLEEGNDLSDDAWADLVRSARTLGFENDPGAPAGTALVRVRSDGPHKPQDNDDGRNLTRRASVPARVRRMATLSETLRSPTTPVRALSSVNMAVASIDAEKHGRERPQWGSRLEYLLSVIGFAVGLGNVWRAPKLFMENGGGAFLIPYFVMMFVVGMPIFVLELGAGQMFQRTTCKLWGKIDRRLAGVGWASAFVAYVGSFYYNVVITWSVYYLGVSFKSPLPWTTANPAACMRNATADTAAEQYWTECVTHSTHFTDPEWTTVNWPLAVCLAIAWLVCFFALRQGIESSGKVVLVTATFPYVVLFVLFVRGVTLEGAAEGIRYFVTPTFSKLAEPSVWIRAANQCFYSLGAGFGAHVSYASYNPRSTPFFKDAVLVTVVNAATSIFAGFVVFSILGHLAHEQGVPVQQLSIGGPGLAFIAYPTAISLIPWGNVWALSFFVMLGMLGIDSQLGTVEVFATALIEQQVWFFKPENQQRSIAFICALGFVAGIGFVTYGGVDMVDVFDYYIALYALFVVCFFELFAVVYVHGVAQFREQVRLETGTTLPGWLLFLWKWVNMPVLAVLVGLSIYSAAQPDFLGPEFPPWTLGLGWALASAPVLILVGMFFRGVHRNALKGRYHAGDHPPTVKIDRTASKAKANQPQL